MKRALRISLISVGALLLLVLGAEVAASFTRAGNAAYFIEDDAIFIARKPGMRGYTLGNGDWIPCNINKQGLRAEEDLPDPRPPGERWILCVGDSFTFGGGVSGLEAWPHQLQELLGPPEASGVRVLNGGANGWDTRWQRRYLEARALDAFRPDVVLLGWNWNDLTVNTQEEMGAHYVSRFLEARGTWLEPFARRAWVRETHLYRWVYTRQVGGHKLPSDATLERNFTTYAQLMTKVGIEPEQRVAEARKLRFGDGAPDTTFWEASDTEAWKLVRRELAAIAAACKERGAVFAVAMFPEPTWEGPGTFPGTERLAAILDGLGVPWVDVQPDFLGRGPRGQVAQRRKELWLRYDPVHPVAEGHTLMAQRALGLLREQGLVPAPLQAGGSAR